MSLFKQQVNTLASYEAAERFLEEATTYVDEASEKEKEDTQLQQLDANTFLAMIQRALLEYTKSSKTKKQPVHVDEYLEVAAESLQRSVSSYVIPETKERQATASHPIEYMTLCQVSESNNNNHIYHPIQISKCVAQVLAKLDNLRFFVASTIKNRTTTTTTTTSAIVFSPDAADSINTILRCVIPVIDVGAAWDSKQADPRTHHFSTPNIQSIKLSALLTTATLAFDVRARLSSSSTTDQKNSDDITVDTLKLFEEAKALEVTAANSEQSKVAQECYRLGELAMKQSLLDAADSLFSRGCFHSVACHLCYSIETKKTTSIPSPSQLSIGSNHPR